MRRDDDRLRVLLDRRLRAAGALTDPRIGELAILSAEELAYAATVLGRPEALEELMAGYAEVGPDEVRDAALKYLRPDEGATIVVVPRPGVIVGEDE